MTLDIVIGSVIGWYGNDAIVTDIDGESISLEVCGEDILTDIDEVAEQNPELIIEE